MADLLPVESSRVHTLSGLHTDQGAPGTQAQTPRDKQYLSFFSDLSMSYFFQEAKKQAAMAMLEKLTSVSSPSAARALVFAGGDQARY